MRKPKNPRIAQSLGVAILLIGLISLYQNCGAGFSTAELSRQQSLQILPGGTATPPLAAGQGFSPTPPLPPPPGVSASASPSPTPVISLAPGQQTWLINHGAFKLLQELEATTGSTLASQYFSNSKTYFMVGASTPPSAIPPQSLPTMTFTSYQDLEKAFANGKIGPQIQAIIYDNEYWSATPVNEQQDPGTYYKLAADLVHLNNLKFIATPATDLVKALEPNYTGLKYPEFIRLGVASSAAKYADIYEIQAQGSEMNISLFTTFVSQAAAQAKAANPNVMVLAGISTNPSGQTLTGAQVFAAVQASSGIVDGYWLNIPGQSSYCPLCGTPQPQVAEDLLLLMSKAQANPN